MPGLVDAHVHPVLGGMEKVTQCLFPSTAGPDEIKVKMAQCIAEKPSQKWLVGGRWASTFFSDYDIESPVAWLDQAAKGRAVSLADDTGHNRWVNSRAMELAGIDSASSITGGEVVLDAAGEPSGLLREAAIWPVMQVIERDMRPTTADYLAAARQSFDTASRYGITGVKEAGDADQGIIAYKTLDDNNALNLHLGACIAVQFNSDGSPDLQRVARLRKENRGRNFQVNCAKLFLDGVPSQARTAAMIDPYLPEQEGGESHNGKLLIPPARLNRVVAQLDGMGLTVKAHVAGDRAVRVFLDAIEYAREVNGNSGLRHELGHSGFINKADIQRIVALDAVADMSPSIWYPAPVTDSIIVALGNRGKHYWPFRDLLEAGVNVIVGSDWPAVVSDMNPWTGLEAMVTRRHPLASYPGTLWPEQAISLADAIRINTLNGAKALGLESVTGSLEVGKYADIIVLSHNLFDITPEQISDTNIEMTLFKGAVVYRKAQ